MSTLEFCHLQCVATATGPRWLLLGPDEQPLAEPNRFLDTFARRGLAAGSLRTYAYDLLCAHRWLYSRRLDPRQIGAEQLLDFADYQRRLPHATATTINRRLALLQRFGTFLTGHATPHTPSLGGYPLRCFRRPRSALLRLPEEQRVLRPLSDPQATRFFQSLRCWRDRAMVLLLWALGLRSDELLRLRLGDLDLHHLCVTVYGKRRKERALPLAEPVVKPLLHYLALERPATACTPHLFVVLKGPYRGQPMRYSTLRQLFRYHRRKTQIPLAHPHRFRHTFGANMTRAHLPLPVLARMMGHSSAQTTLRYIALHDEELRAAYFQALNDLKEGLPHA
jgi:site-specific recombinase XerD